MPTRYTAAINDGITFDQFVMNCASAFGGPEMKCDTALIPEQCEPSDYHAKRLKEAQENLAWHQNMADSEAEREAKKSHEEQLKQHEKRIAAATDLRNKYNAMLAQVIQWDPPTSDHHVLKGFMVQQIQKSIDSDCDTTYLREPVKLSAAEWKLANIREAQHAIDYHTKAHQKEVERIESLNALLRDLRNSGVTCVIS